MKKLTSLLLVLVMLFSVVALSSCADKGFDYQNEDLTPYVTLAALSEKLKANVADLAAKIEIADVEKEINDALEAAFAYYKKIEDKEEVVALGDMVGIDYKGVLASTLKAAGFNEDGTKTVKGEDGTETKVALTDKEVDALSGFSGGKTSTTVNYMVGMGAYTASSGSYSKYIDDLDKGLIGHKIGEKNAPIPCTFPEDYSSTELKGKDVVFFTTFQYELQSVEPREIDYEDLVAITYSVKFNEADEVTQANKEAYEKENGELPKEPVATVILLNDDDLFHALVKTSFNDPEFGAGIFDKAYQKTAERNLVIEIEKENEETGETEPGKQDVTILLDYTITVHKLANVRCFTTQDVKDGTLEYINAKKTDDKKDEGEGEPSAQADDHDHEGEEEKKEETKDTVTDSLVEYLKIDKEKYPTYDKYVEGLQEDMQKQRDIQIAANKYQAAFDAMIAASTFASFDTNETLKDLKQKYIDEINGNIEYLARNVEASGYASIYMQIAGVTTVEEYAMSVYGYTKSNIKKQLPIDAEEYVKGRLVFWQLLKEHTDLTLTDAEYTDGLENYKEIHGDTFIEDYGYTEEAVREALQWDKVAKWLCDNHVEFTYKAEKK